MLIQYQDFFQSKSTGVELHWGNNAYGNKTQKQDCLFKKEDKLFV